MAPTVQEIVNSVLNHEDLHQLANDPLVATFLLIILLFICANIVNNTDC